MSLPMSFFFLSLASYFNFICGVRVIGFCALFGWLASGGGRLCLRVPLNPLSVTWQATELFQFYKLCKHVNVYFFSSFLSVYFRWCGWLHPAKYVNQIILFKCVLLRCTVCYCIRKESNGDAKRAQVVRISQGSFSPVLLFTRSHRFLVYLFVIIISLVVLALATYTRTFCWHGLFFFFTFSGGFSLPGASASALGQAALRLSGQSGASGSVLLVSNLNEEVYSANLLFNCFLEENSI